MVILYFVRWFNIILVLRFLFQPGRLCTKLGFFVYYYLPYCYLHQTQENENVRTIKEGKIILKIALRLWSYVLDFLFSNPIVWSYIFRRILILSEEKVISTYFSHKSVPISDREIIKLYNLKILMLPLDYTTRLPLI